MFKRALAIFATGLILPGCMCLTTYAQDYENEVLTMFTRGTIEFPGGKTSAGLAEVKFTPPEIGQVIASYGGVTMTIAFPDYKR